MPGIAQQPAAANAGTIAAIGLNIPVLGHLDQQLRKIDACITSRGSECQKRPFTSMNTAGEPLSFVLDQCYSMPLQG
jgi:hypothetical protein